MEYQDKYGRVWACYEDYWQAREIERKNTEMEAAFFSRVFVFCMKAFVTAVIAIFYISFRPVSGFLYALIWYGAHAVMSGISTSAMASGSTVTALVLGLLGNLGVLLFFAGNFNKGIAILERGEAMVMKAAFDAAVPLGRAVHMALYAATLVGSYLMLEKNITDLIRIFTTRAWFAESFSTGSPGWLIVVCALGGLLAVSIRFVFHPVAQYLTLTGLPLDPDEVKRKRAERAAAARATKTQPKTEPPKRPGAGLLKRYSPER